ncbi:MAG: glycosyltransferase family 2 protein, partial [Alphaproteobacteria bacterium]|nr:glycosyltransferase family 2 protein [Alphaproteobacteria bacterium]
ALIESIRSPKIKIFNSTWDMTAMIGGKVMAEETNKALSYINPNANWAFYIQADEVLHEKYHAIVLETCLKYVDNSKVLGLVFHYKHFWGNYDYYGVSRMWYDKEIRIIKPNNNIYSYRDAQGFRRLNNQKIPCKLIPAFMYHYGWVKHPKKMQENIDNVKSKWAHMNHDPKSAVEFDYNNINQVKLFNETHPLVMQNRIARLNWKLNLKKNGHGIPFKHKLLNWFERKTGTRLFSFKNYKLV